jgi:hypothetical protein
MIPFLPWIFLFLVTTVTAQTGRKKKTTKGKRKALYNKFEKNKLIDAAVHPLADQHWAFILADGFLHALNEDNPSESFLKFLKYNAPELLKRILKDLK